MKKKLSSRIKSESMKKLEKKINKSQKLKRNTTNITMVVRVRLIHFLRQNDDKNIFVGTN